MKKILILLVFSTFTVFLNGCDLLLGVNSYRVMIYNVDFDKYITAVYYQDANVNSNRWSKNMIYEVIYPDEYESITISEGTYDFRVIMEDDYYSYEVFESFVHVNSDISLEICVDCYDKNPSLKVTRTPKTDKKVSK